jgi:hypothetical protein
MIARDTPRTVLYLSTTSNTFDAASVSPETSPYTPHIQRDQQRQIARNLKRHLGLAVDGRGGTVIARVRVFEDFCAGHENVLVCRD